MKIGKWWGLAHPHESLWSDTSSEKRTYFRHVLISNANKTFLLDIFCGSSSTLFSAFVLICAACYMYFFFLENTLYMYIEFDNTNYTRCLAFSILTAFNSNVCFTERYAQSAKRLVSICANEDRDRVNLIVSLIFKGTLKWSNASALV